MKQALCVVLFSLLVALAAGPARPAGRNAALDLSVGLFIPTDGNNRDLFGAGEALGVGLPMRVSTSGWVLLDAAFIHAAGAETQADPTFEVADTQLWLVPLTLGWRFNAATNGEERRSRLYLGFGFQTWLSWYDPPVGATRFAPGLGGLIEWRQEIDLGVRRTVFIEQRLFLTTKQTFGGRIGDIGYSGTTLVLGLSHRLR